MKIEYLLSEIAKIINDRFIIDNSQLSNRLIDEAPSELSIKQVIRIKHNNCPDLTTFKTILVVSIENEKELVYPLKWIATVKEMLLDPESADLYLFVFQNGNISLESCLRIESTEQFCRKYILYPEESFEHFLGRTFFTKLAVSAEDILDSDPLLKAFSAVQKDHKWFASNEQKRWAEIFLSGKTSAELIEDLITINTENNEISK